MLNVPVEELSMGAVVAQNVLDLSGRMLVPAGTVLTAKHLRAFKIWGVEKVTIASAEDSAEPDRSVIPRDADPEQLEKARAIAAERFRHAPTDLPAMSLLHDLCVSRLLARILAPPPENAP